MEKPSTGLFSIKSFRNKYLALTILAALCFSLISNGQIFTPIHNAQAPDYISVIKYFGIPYGSTPALNSTRTIPGALFFNTTDSALYRWTGTQWLLLSGSGGAVNAIYNCNRLDSGTVTYTSGLTFHATNLFYHINCRQYSSVATDLTLDAADPTYTRFDYIYVDTLGNIGRITGVPGANPYFLAPDPASQLLLLTVQIDALATTPTGIYDIDIYKENVEWTGSTAIPSADFAYTVNPYAGLLSTYIPAFVNKDTIAFLSSTTYSLSGSQFLKFNLKQGAIWPSNIRLAFRFYYNNTPVTSAILLNSGNYNYLRTSTVWQGCAIPMGNFTPLSPSFLYNKIIISTVGGPILTGFQLDNITVQYGGALPVSNGLLSFNGRYDPNVLLTDADVQPHAIDSMWLIGKTIYRREKGVTKFFTIPTDTNVVKGPHLRVTHGVKDTLYTNQSSLDSASRLAIHSGTGISYDSITGIITGSGGGGTSRDSLAYFWVSNDSLGTACSYCLTFHSLKTDSVARFIGGSSGSGGISKLGTGQYGLSDINDSTYRADTTSSDGLVGKARLTNALALKADKATTLTINGSTQDLSANRSWSVGTLVAGDTVFLHNKLLFTIAKNATKDSTIYTYYDGSRVAIKDSVGAGGGGLPSQTSKVNSYLKTDGTSASWSRFKFNSPAIWEVYGDSYTIGQGATVPSSEGYIFLLSALYNKTIFSRAATGSGIFTAAKNHNTNVNPTTQAVPVNTAMTVTLISQNDLNRAGYNVKTIRKVTNGFKAIILNQFLDSYAGAGAGTGVTRTGTWSTAYNNVTHGGKFTTAASTATNGSYIEYAFIGENINVALQGGDGVNAIRATFDVTIDGVSQGSFTENNQADGINDATNGVTNQRSPMALNFPGLTDSNHIIRLTNTSSDTLVVDYFGIMKKPAFCFPILIYEIAEFITYVSGSDALTLLANNSIDSLVATYPTYPIVVAKTNNYFTSYNADNIHPSTKGHRQIFEAGYRALDSLLNPDVTPYLYTGNPSGIGNNIINGGLRVTGNVSGTLPQPLSGGALDLFYATGSTSGTIRTYNGGYLPLAIQGSQIDIGLGPHIKILPTTGNVQVQYTGVVADIPSSLLTVLSPAPTSYLPKASIPAPRMTRSQRDSITTSILTNTKLASGSGYSASGSAIALTCVTCANPLAAGAVAASINVSAGAVTTLSAAIGGSGYTVGDVLAANFNSGTGFQTTVTTLNTGVAGEQVYVSDQNTLSTYNGSNWNSNLVSSSAAAINLYHGTDYVFTGTTTTWTLPAVSASIIGRQNRILIYNRGSGAITLNSNAGSTIYTTSAVSTFNIAAGAKAEVFPDGTYFIIQ